MKKLFFLILLFVSVQSFGQFTKFYSNNQYLGVWGDSITNIANRDTTVNPYKIGETRFRIADSTVYISISTSADNKWMKLKGYVPTGVGTGTVTSVDASISGALGVTGGPITGSGTLAFAWQGAGTDVVLGNGSYTPYSSLITGVTNYLYSPIGHSHIASDISDFVSAARSSFTAGTGINITSGVISATLSGTGISSLNGLRDTSQTLAIDTTYTGAASWSSVGTAHTLRLPARLFTEKLISISYSTLTSAISSSLLVPGQSYLITDFATTYKIYGTSTDASGSTEPLVVKATSDSTISSIAFSPSHPEDIIYYALTDNSVLAPSTGSKGVITYRADTRNNLSTYYDFRAVKWRRWSLVNGAIYYAFTGSTPAYNSSQYIDTLTFMGSAHDIHLGSATYNVTIETGCFDIKIGNGCGSPGAGIYISSNSYSINIDDECATVQTTGSGYIGGIYIGGLSRDIRIGSRSYNIQIGSNCYALDFGVQNSDVFVPDNTFRRRLEKGFSNFEVTVPLSAKTIDLYNTQIDVLSPYLYGNANYCGVIYLTSPNATDTLDKINSLTTSVNWSNKTIIPASGLNLLVRDKSDASTSGSNIDMGGDSLVLNGTKNQEAVFHKRMIDGTGAQPDDFYLSYTNTALSSGSAAIDTVSFSNNTITIGRNGLSSISGSWDSTLYHSKGFYDGVYAKPGDTATLYYSHHYIDSAFDGLSDTLNARNPVLTSSIANAPEKNATIYKVLDSLTGEWVTYKKTTTWLDGNAMTDAKVDSVWFIKRNGSYYQRQWPNGVINLAAYGVKANSTNSVHNTNNSPIIQKVFDYIPITTPAEIFLPPSTWSNVYYCDTTLTIIDKEIHFFTHGQSTRLLFPTKRIGIHYSRTTGNRDWAKFENLQLYSFLSTDTAYQYDGFLLESRCRVINCYVSYFSGAGVKVVANIGNGTVASGALIDGLRTFYCGDGVAIVGSDANAVNITNLETIDSRRYNIRNAAFLTLNVRGWLSEGNVSGDIYQSDVNCFSLIEGAYWESGFPKSVIWGRSTFIGGNVPPLQIVAGNNNSVINFVSGIYSGITFPNPNGPNNTRNRISIRPDTTSGEMQLNLHGGPGNGPSLINLHGLFNFSNNWQWRMATDTSKHLGGIMGENVLYNWNGVTRYVKSPMMNIEGAIMQGKYLQSQTSLANITYGVYYPGDRVFIRPYDTSKVNEYICSVRGSVFANTVFCTNPNGTDTLFGVAGHDLSYVGEGDTVTFKGTPGVVILKGGLQPFWVKMSTVMPTAATYDTLKPIAPIWKAAGMGIGSSAKRTAISLTNRDVGYSYWDKDSSKMFIWDGSQWVGSTSGGGGGGGISTAVDTIYRTPGKDSIQYTINGRYHAIRDSVGASVISGLTTGYMPYATSSTNIGNGPLYYDAVNNRIGWGITNPTNMIYFKNTAAPAHMILESTPSGGYARFELRSTQGTSGLFLQADNGTGKNLILSSNNANNGNKDLNISGYNQTRGSTVKLYFTTINLDGTTITLPNTPSTYSSGGADLLVRNQTSTNIETLPTSTFLQQGTNTLTQDLKFVGDTVRFGKQVVDSADHVALGSIYNPGITAGAGTKEVRVDPATGKFTYTDTTTVSGANADSSIFATHHYVDSVMKGAIQNLGDGDTLLTQVGTDTLGVKSLKATGATISSTDSTITINVPISYGIYTPTISNTTNVTGQGSYSCHYFKVGNEVHVSGKVTITPTASNTTTTFSLSLPVSTANFTADVQAAGTGNYVSGSTFTGAIIYATTGGQTVWFSYNSANTSAEDFYFEFTYTIQ